MRKAFPFSKFSVLFVGIVLLDLFIGSFGYGPYRFLTKPLILISLIVYFGHQGKHLPRSVYFPMLLALFFSLLGDILLLYDTLFLMGLVSFLIAHLLYASLFLKKCHRRPNGTFWSVTVLLLIYGATLFFILRDALAGLQWPVIIYIVGILGMAVSAYGRKGSVNAISFQHVFFGALLFVASDSILAWNKFMFPLPLSHFWVMGTYAAAQYFIVSGILKEDQKK